MIQSVIASLILIPGVFSHPYTRRMLKPEGGDNDGENGKQWKGLALVLLFILICIIIYKLYKRYKNRNIKKIENQTQNVAYPQQVILTLPEGIKLINTNCVSSLKDNEVLKYNLDMQQSGLTGVSNQVNKVDQCTNE